MNSSTEAFKTIGVIGGGAWGTALASLTASNAIETTLWAREPDVADAINTHHENTIFLPGMALPESLKATSNLEEMATPEALIFVVPSQFARGVIADLKDVTANAQTPIALCAKGIEQSSGLLMTEVIKEVWPEAKAAVLSGPSFAADVVKGLPTAVTLAAAETTLGEKWAKTIAAAHFRPYLSDDLLGTELGGAVKNVLAIAAGTVTGLGFGDSARAALIARGFAEFQRLGVALGARKETMAGLSGLGDLILTAGSFQSRNMSLGAELGKGRSLKEILEERQSVAEGVATSKAVTAMAACAGIEMPICTAVADLVESKKELHEIVKELLSRPLKTENN